MIFNSSKLVHDNNYFVIKFFFTNKIGLEEYMMSLIILKYFKYFYPDYEVMDSGGGVEKKN